METLLTAWLILSAAHAGGRQAPARLDAPARPPARVDTRPSQGPRVTPLRLSGVLREFEEKTRVITVMTSERLVRLSISRTTRINRGRRRITLSSLGHYIGAMVVVRYADSAAVPVVLSLRIVASGHGQRN